MTHCGVHLNAGYEIGVASTKAYTSQVGACHVRVRVRGWTWMGPEARRRIRLAHPYATTDV